MRLATHSLVDGGFAERFLNQFIENVVAQKFTRESRCESRSTFDQFDRLLSTFSPPDGAVSPVPLELLMCHWFGIGAGFSFVFFLQVGDETTDQFISDQWLGAGGWS